MGDARRPCSGPTHPRVRQLSHKLSLTHKITFWGPNSLSYDKNKIDLHGLTVRESITIVREGVNEWWSSAGSGMPRSSCSFYLGLTNKFISSGSTPTSS